MGDSFEHPLRELLGLDKQLRSIQGSLKVEVAKKIQLGKCIAKDDCKLKEIRGNPELDLSIGLISVALGGQTII